MSLRVSYVAFFLQDLERRCGRMGDDGLRGFELAEEAR